MISWYTQFLVVLILLKKHCFIIRRRFVCSFVIHPGWKLVLCKEWGSKNWIAKENMNKIHRIERHVREIGLEQIFSSSFRLAFRYIFCCSYFSLMWFSHLTTSSTRRWAGAIRRHTSKDRKSHHYETAIFIFENHKKGEIPQLWRCLNPIRVSRINL